MATTDPQYNPTLTGGSSGPTLTASTLAGRGNASGTGTPEQIALGAGLAMSGTTLNVSASSEVASWSGSPTVYRWYALSEDTGSDSNVGYSDTSGADALTKAVATPDKLRSVIPADGKGRSLAIYVRPRNSGATYDGNLDLRGLVGYNNLLIRASWDGADTALEKIINGAINAVTGPGTGGACTVTAGTDAITFTTDATLPSANSLRGCRWRWDPATPTVEFRNKCFPIYSNGSGAGAQIKLNYWSGTGPTPAVGDFGYIEKPGAVFNDIMLPMSCLNEFYGGVISGFQCVGAVHSNFPVTGGYWLMSFMQLGGTYFRDMDGLEFRNQYWDHVSGAMIGTGLGAKITGDYQFYNIKTVVAEAMAFTGTGSVHGFQNVDRLILGTLASQFAHMPPMQNCGYGRSRVPDSSFSLFGSYSAAGPSVPTIVYGPPPGAGPTIDGSCISLDNIDFTAMGSRGLELNGDGIVVALNTVTGSTGNTGPGIDMTRARGATVIMNGSNSIAGTSGDILMASGATVAHADFAKVGYVEEATGNKMIGTAGLTSGVPAIAVTNNSGGALTPGNSVFLSAASTVQKSNAAAAGTAKLDGVMVSGPANGALGLMVPPTGAPYMLCQNAVAAVSQLNLSAVTAGTVTDATPAITVAVGRALDANGVKTAVRAVLNNK